MSLRLAFPTAALDGRVHREEELTLARTTTHRKPSDGPATATATAGDPTVPPAAGRRRVALPDPVAFK